MALLPFAKGLVGALWRDRRYGAEQLRKTRDARLSRIVLYARERTELYRERLAHIDPNLPINLAQIEPVTKAELMDRFDAGIADGRLSFDQVADFARNTDCAGKPLNGHMVATTSGTTGRVGYFVHDLPSFAEMNGVLLARVLRDRLVPHEIARFCWGRRYRMAMVIADGGPFITKLVSDFSPVPTRAVVSMKPFSITDTVESVVSGLNRFRPHYVHCYPTFLEMLAHEKREGRLSIDPEFVSLGSEPFSASARQAITAAFPRAQLSETYGATECLAMANQCTAGRMHINEDVCILEPVDRAGRPVPVGVASDKAYLTNFINRAQPLLRYEISDSITLLGDDCPCGSPMMSLRVEGRADDTIYLSDENGRFSAHPPVPFEALFLRVRGLLQYQLVHIEQNHLHVRLVLEEGADPASCRREVMEVFSTYLSRYGLVGAVDITVEFTSDLERTSGHKLRQIYSKVPRPIAV